MPGDNVPLLSVRARAFRVPTSQPESDGTAEWDSTTLILVEVAGGGAQGVGYSYGDAAAAGVVNGVLADTVCGRNAWDIPARWRDMAASVRNIGWPGLAAYAISAVDAALWDLKARLMDMPLTRLLGGTDMTVEIYGSGGFTSMSDTELQTQLAGWVGREGCKAVKMKIGRDPARDPARMRAARAAIGAVDLFVDANGALAVKQAQLLADMASDMGVVWFEEPVPSDDLAGLRRLREHTPPGMDIAAGEYGYTPFYFREMLAAGAVDVLQADATRCGGITGFLKAAVLAEAFHTPLSAHCAPALTLPVAAAAPGVRHIEWFHDHARIEAMLFDGAPRPDHGAVRPDLSRPGLGLEFRTPDAEVYAL